MPLQDQIVIGLIVAMFAMFGGALAFVAHWSRKA